MSIYPTRVTCLGALKAHWSLVILRASQQKQDQAERGHAYTESKIPVLLSEEILEDPLHLDAIVVPTVEDLMYLDLFGFGHCGFVVEVHCCLLDDEECFLQWLSPEVYL